MCQNSGHSSVLKPSCNDKICVCGGREGGLQNKIPLERISINSMKGAESAKAQGPTRQLLKESKETHNIQAQEVIKRERKGIRRKGRCL